MHQEGYKKVNDIDYNKNMHGESRERNSKPMGNFPFTQFGMKKNNTGCKESFQNGFLMYWIRLSAPLESIRVALGSCQRNIHSSS